VRATRKLASFLGPYKLWVILAPLMMALEVAMDLLQPRLIQRIIDDGIARQDQGVVLRTGALMVGFAIIGLIGGVLCGIFAIRAAQGFGADLRWSLFSKVQTLSFGNLDRLETGGLITRLTTDVTQLSDAVAMLLRIMIRAPLLLVGSLVMGTLTSPKLALIFFVLLPREAFASGDRMITVKVSDGDDFDGEFPYRLLGPRAGSAPDDDHDASGADADDTSHTDAR